jgi:hypothetical protein
LLAADVEAADGVLATVNVPGDATVLDVILEVTDLDSGAGLVIDVGDASDDDRFIAAFSGQAAGAIRASANLLAGVITYAENGDQAIEATVNTVAATGIDGTLTLTVVYVRTE